MRRPPIFIVTAVSHSSGVGNAQYCYGIKSGTAADAPWTNSIHVLRGNVLILDGSVSMTDTKALDDLIDLGDDTAVCISW